MIHSHAAIVCLVVVANFIIMWKCDFHRTFKAIVKYHRPDLYEEWRKKNG